MSPSRPFILRPVATSLLMLAILLTGAVAFGQLPLSALPDVEYPTIQVKTFYPGAAPDVMSTAVTAPLEVQFGEMPGLSEMLSSSSAGASVITLQFDLDTDLDVAEQEVQAAINAAGSLLPPDLPAQPVYAKVNPADPPILTLALTSATLTLPQLDDLAEARLARKISQLPGVGLVSINGGQRPAIRIRADPRKLAAYGLGIDELRVNLGSESIDSPKGAIDGPRQDAAIDGNDQLPTAASYRNLVIAYRNGDPVHLADVAGVADGAEDDELAAWMNRTPAVILNIQREPNANVIQVVDRIEALLPALKGALPAAVNLTALTDRTSTIRASVADVELELALAVILVVLVIFVFLGDWRATAIPSLAVPVSLVGSFGAMYLLGFSLDNLSLMALTIATGFVVDDAIVMIENIARHLEAGLPPLQAALKGSAQVGFTIISLTVSLIAVLIPLLFMGDVIGRLFREFALTLAVTIVISAIVSLTLAPMLCARLLGGAPAGGEAGFRRWSRRQFDRLSRGYGRMLDRVLDHQPATLAVAIATVALTIGLYAEIPKGFFPVEDTGLIQGISEAPENISYRAMARRQQALADAVLTDRDVQGLSSFIGVDGTNTTLNSGRMLISLRPRDRRRSSVSQVIRRLQQETAGVSGIALHLQPVQDLTVDTAVGRAQYQFVLADADPDELAAWVPRLVDRLSRLPQFADVASDLEARGAALEITIDHATASRFGITPAIIDNALYDAFGQRIISTVFTSSNQYRVILEETPALQRSIRSLAAIYLPSSGTPGGTGQVPLSAFVHVEQGTAPLQIDHLGQFPSATVSFDLAASASLGAAIPAIEQAERDIGMPASVATSFQGAALAFRAALGNELLLLLAAMVTVYIVLGVLYESFIHPVTILSTLPSAGIGALLALRLAGSDLTIIAIIGIVLLIGIVKKNAIMMIDFAIAAEREQGLTPRAAIHQACLLRLRPILMTTMAALLGALPLIAGGGIGAELRQPLGITVVGGLILSQLLTLFTTPVIYLAFGRLAMRGARRGRQRSPAS